MAPEGTNPEGGQQSNEENYVRMKREDIKKLEEAAKKAQDAEQLQREILFLKTGVTTDSALGKMFFKSYEGELSVEAIKAAAQEIGLVEKTQENPPLQEGEASATRERQALANNATPDTGSPDKDPRQAALEKAEEIIKQGGTFEQAGAGFLSTKMQAFAAGDKRAIRDPRNLPQ
jgi:hypothetical protein